MKNLIIIALLLVLILLQGCQLDIQGPSLSAKAFYKTENGGDIYKSRGSGMAGGNSYASDGGRMEATGNGSDKFFRTFFNTSPDRFKDSK
jgi:hypothetical protein